MDLAIIEQALRAGPPDEPEYIPGRFSRRKGRSWSLLAAAVLVVVTLVSGIAVGVGISAVWLPTPGPQTGSVDLRALDASLQGNWDSLEISHDDAVDALAALGVNRYAAIAFAPSVGSTMRIRIHIADGHLQIFRSDNGDAYVSQSGGPYRLLPSGDISYDDIGCFITIPFLVTGDHLVFDPISTENCDGPGTNANRSFFNLSVFTRVRP